MRGLGFEWRNARPRLVGKNRYGPPLLTIGTRKLDALNGKGLQPLHYMLQILNVKTESWPQLRSNGPPWTRGWIENGPPPLRNGPTLLSESLDSRNTS